MPGRVKELRELGFRIAIDNLGAGYAGLATFTQLEPDVAKLDMSLVRDIDTQPKKQSMVHAMVQLCTELSAFSWWPKGLKRAPSATSSSNSVAICCRAISSPCPNEVFRARSGERAPSPACRAFPGNLLRAGAGARGMATTEGASRKAIDPLRVAARPSGGASPLRRPRKTPSLRVEIVERW